MFRLQENEAVHRRQPPLFSMYPHLTTFSRQLPADTERHWKHVGMTAANEHAMVARLSIELCTPLGSEADPPFTPGLFTE
jgi:hypothetical protein